MNPEDQTTSSPAEGAPSREPAPTPVSPSARIAVPPLSPLQSVAPVPSSSPPVMNPRAVLLVFAVFVCLGVYAAVGDLSGGLGAFVLAGLEVFLFVLLAMTAYLAEDFPGLKVAAVLLLFCLIGGFGLAVVGGSIIAILPPDAFSLTDPAAPIPDDLLSGADLLRVVAVFFGVVIAALVSCVGFLRPVRVRLARHLPFDPDSFIHQVALALVLALTLISGVPLVFLGEPIFLAPAFLEIVTSGVAGMEGMAAEVYSLLWIIGAAFLVVGLFIRRDVRATCIRLGLTRPTARDIAVAVGFGLVLVGVFAGVDFIIGRCWEFLGWQTTDMDAVELLFAPLLTPAGIVVASVAAGFGEELSIRGVLQPRFGILLPSMLFAALHAFQYNWDGVISVFLAGIVFALIRRHYSTTVSAVTHTVYDLVLFSALLVGIGC